MAGTFILFTFLVRRVDQRDPLLVFIPKFKLTKVLQTISYQLSAISYQLSAISRTDFFRAPVKLFTFGESTMPLSSLIRKFTVLIIMLVVGISLSGCYMRGSIEDISEKEPIKMVPSLKTAAAEINSGSRNGFLTNNNYSVGYSLGNISGNISSKSNDGYLVFMTVQGSVASESTP